MKKEEIPSYLFQLWYDQFDNKVSSKIPKINNPLKSKRDKVYYAEYKNGAMFYSDAGKHQWMRKGDLKTAVNGSLKRMMFNTRWIYGSSLINFIIQTDLNQIPPPAEQTKNLYYNDDSKRLDILNVILDEWRKNNMKFYEMDLNTGVKTEVFI